MRTSEEKLYDLINAEGAEYYAYSDNREILISIDEKNFFYNKPVACVEVIKSEDKLILISHNWDAMCPREIGKRIDVINEYVFSEISEKDIDKRFVRVEKPFGFFR